MKLSFEWLSEFTDIGGISAKEYSDRMTDTGSKVEGFELLGEDIENVVVGKIVKITPHENSDHLQICQLDCGEGELRQIVTGAQNVFEGAYVPVAMAPAKLPGGIVIKAGKLRGVESNGMLCSIGELNLTTGDMPYAIEDGILILEEPDMKVGTDIRDLLQLRDTVIEFEITPNRPDCLSVIGLARETGASFEKSVTYHKPTVKGCGGDVKDYIDVEVKNDVLCPRYTAMVVKNVKIEPSPMWMRTRLRASGVRPINNIVDITNYVMLEYGQPMHAFDYKCLDGKKITVREAEENEEFVSLDNKPHTLKKGMLVIADEKKAVALAGIMGGLNSEIESDTNTVVFESANFEGASVRITGRALGMRTEASGRFEKGLDPENTMDAVLRACELVEMLGAGEVVNGVIDVYGGKKEETVIPLEADKINKFIGIDLSEEEMKKILLSLDFVLDGNMIHVPSYRQDVLCMNDIAEEIARIYGYNMIPSTSFRASVNPGLLTPVQSYREMLNNLMCSMGAYETCTFSFVSPKNVDKINLPADSALRNYVVITNPLGEDTSVMRTTTVPSVLDCLAHNYNNHDSAVTLYEISKVYLPTGVEGELPDERYRLCVASFGKGDFYTMKGMVQAVLSATGIKDARFAADATNPTYHPGRCACVKTADGTVLGVFGELHPAVAENYGFDCRVYVADLDVEALFDKSCFEKVYTPLPKYPATSRDFAFLCDESMEVGTIEEVMRRAGGKTVEDVKLFDVYRGKQVPEGKKSVAFNVTMRLTDRTMTDEDADKIVKKILTLLERELGLTLRA
ncbi:MAG: phenylalanine--tRNA ligase subunit beta [Ruminococcaceae bacterium]|nr:phenylalanine--tRNA ligase subunit beta [Oscillospiraceae bacterium]